MCRDSPGKISKIIFFFRENEALSMSKQKTVDSTDDSGKDIQINIQLLAQNIFMT